VPTRWQTAFSLAGVKVDSDGTSCAGALAGMADRIDGKEATRKREFGGLIQAPRANNRDLPFGFAKSGADGFQSFILCDTPHSV
jgi:hypothetical protein